MALGLIACGLTFTSVIAPATEASASPCDGPNCVPNVRTGAVSGAACEPRRYFPFGLDANGTTLICLANYRDPSEGSWSQAPQLVGVRGSGTPCAGNQGVAQSPDGLPLLCTGQTWQPYTTDLPQA
jgi:hypothetical protein